MQQISDTMKLAAGILPFFDNWETILLGKEYRKKYNDYYWMEFGGKHEKNESLAQTACRETNEETGNTLNVILDHILQAENNGYYIDYYNEKSNVFYRMYCVNFKEKPNIQIFTENTKDKEYVEKTNWKYFDAKSVIFNENGNLPETEVKLYDTMNIRIEKLKHSDFLCNLLH